MSYPAEGSKTRRVWEVADAISRADGKPADRRKVIAQCVEAGINKSTAGVQYRHWAQHWGLPIAKSKQTSQAAPQAHKKVIGTGEPDAHPGGWTIGEEIHAAGVASDIEFDLAHSRKPEYPEPYLAQLNEHYKSRYEIEKDN